jgi:hypothetical protein
MVWGGREFAPENNQLQIARVIPHAGLRPRGDSLLVGSRTQRPGNTVPFPRVIEDLSDAMKRILTTEHDHHLSMRIKSHGVAIARRGTARGGLGPVPSVIRPSVIQQGSGVPKGELLFMVKVSRLGIQRARVRRTSSPAPGHGPDMLRT